MIPIQYSSTYLPDLFPPGTQKNYSVVDALSVLQLLLRFITGLSSNIFGAFIPLNYLNAVCHNERANGHTNYRISMDFGYIQSFTGIIFSSRDYFFDHFTIMSALKFFY